MSANRASRKRNAGDSSGAEDSHQQQQRQIDSSPNEQQEGVDEYTMKRIRNNAAVNRTRQKKRMEQAHTSQRVKQLREENAQLERSLDTMRRELALLKEMVVVCASKGDGNGGGSKQ